MKERPYKKFFCDRKDIFRIPSNAMKVWLYHYQCEQIDRRSWPSLETVAKNCCLNRETIVRQRNWLVAHGWLEKVGKRSGKHGHFSVAEFRVKRGAVPTEHRITEHRITEHRETMPDQASKNDAPTRIEKRCSDAHRKTMLEVDQGFKYINTEVIKEKPMSLKKKISDKCRKTLGIRVHPMADWTEVNSLGRVYGVNETIAAFEAWAESRRGETIKYPLSEFVTVADGILNGTIETRRNPEFEITLTDLYDIGQQAFTGKYQFAVKKIVEEYGAMEVVEAYKEFFSQLNEFKQQTAPKDFCEGGGIAVLGLQVKRKKQQELIDKQLELAANIKVEVPASEPDYGDIEL